MYHRVGNPLRRSIVRGQYAHPWALRWQLSTLRGLGYQPLTLQQMLAEPSNYSGHYAVTFDDGYAGVFRRGLPILQEFQVPITIFMVAGAVGKTNRWDALIGDCVEEMLTAEELRALAAAGHEIASHTMTHARLLDLSDAELRGELVDSKHLLEDLLGQPVHGLAYPYGEFDARVRAATIDAGYRYATTTYQAAIHPHMDPFALTRINMRWNTVGLELTRKIHWASERTFFEPITSFRMPERKRKVAPK
jgi:peptidoglycan/xylan/chitin deacetylase (PgdA/CDA1 family)